MEINCDRFRGKFEGLGTSRTEAAVQCVKRIANMRP